MATQPIPDGQHSITPYLGIKDAARAIDFYKAAGWDEDAIENYRTRFGGYSKYMHAMPDGFRRLSEGEVLRIGAHDWRVVIGRGHSPEHACLVSDALGVMISGDQVLPRISSNVSVFPTEPDANPLGEWIESIARLRATLSDALLVLPAHDIGPIGRKPARS